MAAWASGSNSCRDRAGLAVPAIALPPAKSSHCSTSEHQSSPFIRRGQGRIIQCSGPRYCAIQAKGAGTTAPRFEAGTSWRREDSMAAKTLFEKVWDEHVVQQQAGQPALLYVDLHLVHEVTSPQAFEGLRTSGRKVRVPLR